ncbi:MAG: sugar phosphate nucleotidyltransferase [Patescibacteria group bacterium]
MLYAVIIAGGQGTRLWPASRKNSPKQLKPFAGGESLLQRTYKRVAKIVPHERIYVETNADYAEEFLAQIPELTSDRMILEPEGKNTAPAVGLAAAVLHEIDPEATMINIWSDHFYDDEAGYLQMVETVQAAVEKNPDYVVGIQAIPTYPATGFGYLEAGEVIEKTDAYTLYKCERFVEKPDLETAKQFLATGKYYWNTANFIWKVKTLLNMYQEYAPEVHAGIMKSASAWNSGEWSKVVAEEFSKMPSIAIDYLIFEKANNIAFIPARIGWKDVGSWKVVYDVLSQAEGSGLVTRGKVVTMDAENSLIFNENQSKLVAVAGVDDLVVVDTPDALLVMKKSRDQEIKQVVAQIREMGDDQYL